MLRVRWGGCEVMDDNIPIQTPSWPYSILKYCVAGEGVLDWEMSRWKIRPGMVFWSAARNPNTVSTTLENPMVNLGIILSGDDAVRQIEQYLHVPVGVAEIGEPNEILTTFKTLLAEGRGANEYREDTCALLAEALIRRIAAHVTSPVETNALARTTFRRCREFIERNFLGINSLKSVADGCGVTVPYLCRLFEQFFHCSAYEYMTQLKMNRAESLLLRPQVSVRDVAIAVGYKDARLFSRNFKAAHGKSPTQYRQINAVVEADE
jgi:AraC-like DNA-binding protein